MESYCKFLAQCGKREGDAISKGAVTACRNILVDQKLRQMQHCIILEMLHLFFGQAFVQSPSLLVFACSICKFFRVKLSNYGYG